MVPYSSDLIRLDSSDVGSVSLSASSGEKKDLGSDGNASVVSDSSSGADLAD